MVRVRIELTAFALSAPRSAHWANGPDKIVKKAEAWYHAYGGGYFPPQRAEEDNTLHYLHKFYKYSRFQYFFYYSFKTFPSSHSFYKNFRQQHICLFLDCWRADAFSAKRLILSLCYINVASVNPVSIFYFYYRRRSYNNIKMMIKISLLIVISNIFTLIFDHVIMLTIINRFMDVIWQLESWCGPARAKYTWPQNETSHIQKD